MGASLNAIQIIPIETKPTAKRLCTTRQANSNVPKPSRDSSCESLTIRFLFHRVTLPISLIWHYSLALADSCRLVNIGVSHYLCPVCIIHIVVVV